MVEINFKDRFCRLCYLANLLMSISSEWVQGKYPSFFLGLCWARLRLPSAKKSDISDVDKKISSKNYFLCGWLAWEGLCKMRSKVQGKNVRKVFLHLHLALASMDKIWVCQFGSKHPFPSSSFWRQRVPIKTTKLLSSKFQHLTSDNYSILRGWYRGPMGNVRDDSGK